MRPSPRTRRRLAGGAILGASLLLALTASAQPIADAPSDQAMLDRLRVCASCHGERGQGLDHAKTYYPHLAGKPAGYLFNQLRGFRDGRRHAPQMVWLLQQQSDHWLREIAQWYSLQALPVWAGRPDPGSPADRERVRQLIEDGDPSRELPPCQACHGAELQGAAPEIPGLRGLPADYISAQLGGWRSAARAAEAPDCMGRIARALPAEDVRRLADGLAALPLPAELRPLPALPAPLLEPCAVEAEPRP